MSDLRSLQNTHTGYDVVGNLLSLQDPESNTTTWTYDGLDRVDVETNELSFTRNRSYDFVGNLVSEKDRLNRVTTLEYDHLYRNTHERWYATQADLESGNAVRTFTFEYDLFGRALRSFDADHDYTYGYDDLDRVTSKTMDISGLAPAVALAVNYDRVGNRKQVDATIGGTADFVTEYDYDALYRLTSVQQHGVTGGNAVADKLVTLDYDLAGQFTEVGRYAGLTTSDTAVATSKFTFDQTGRVDTIDHYRQDTIASTHHITGYDLGWDEASRVTSFNFTHALFAGESVTSYTYNDRNELLTADYVGAVNLDLDDEAYTYDDNGNRLTDAADSYTVGDNNQLDNDGTHSYLYDDEGNRSRRTDDTTGAYTVYTWDHRNRLTSVADHAPGGAQTQVVDYQYDSYNQLIGRTVTDVAAGTTTERYFIHDDGQIVLQFDGDTADDLSHRYIWGANVDQQLADEQVDDVAQTGRVVWPLTDHLGTVRDLVEYNTIADDAIVMKHRQYDAFGNVLAEYDRGDFDGDGDLDADDIDLLYQGIALGVFDDFMVDLNGDGVRDAADMDVMIEQILQTLYGDATLNGNVDGEDYVAWLNGFQSGGSGWAMGDFNGDGVVDGQDFLEWNANKFTGDGQVNNTVLEYIFGYTGRLLDDATGLQNNLHRWYDPAAGRWISEDPIGFAAGDANIYRYVGNEPTRWIDPDGLQQSNAVVQELQEKDGWIEGDFVIWQQRGDAEDYWPVSIGVDIEYDNGKVACTVTATFGGRDTATNMADGHNHHIYETDETGVPIGNDGKAPDNDNGAKPVQGKNDEGEPTLTWTIDGDPDRDRDTVVILGTGNVVHGEDGIAVRWDKGADGRPKKVVIRLLGEYNNTHVLK